MFFYLDYGEKDYWDTRYSAPSSSPHYDWYTDLQSSGELELFLSQLIRNQQSNNLNNEDNKDNNNTNQDKDNNTTTKGEILVIGCGDSLLSEQLYLKRLGKTIVSVDYSQSAIDKMKKRSTSLGIDTIHQGKIGTERIYIVVVILIA